MKERVTHFSDTLLGPIPVDEALPIAKQIAEALEAAHEQGIIHRDLKPANIKLRLDGTVQVLDFGLAKALEGEQAQTDQANSPTLTAAASQMGVIMGTAAYMSPEQARGKAVDRRTDIWAFGVVFYEMLTGRRAFEGEDVSLTLSQVLQREPDWDALPGAIPATLATYLRRCLQKDLRQRVQAVGDVRLALEGGFGEVSSPTMLDRARATPAWWPWRTAVVVALCVLVVGASLAAWILSDVTDRRDASPIRTSMTFPDIRFARPMAFTPDGETLVFLGERNGVTQAFRRPLGSLDAIPILGTESADALAVSPDGEWLAFARLDVPGAEPSELRKVPLTGGTSVMVSATGGLLGMAWTTANKIIISRFGSGLLAVSAAGGPETPFTTRQDGEEFHAFPSLLPGGRGLLFTIDPSNAGSQVAVVPLDGGEHKTLLAGSAARYVSSGHLLFVRDDSLWTVGFDLDRLAVVGSPTPVVADALIGSSGQAPLALSGNGTLVYVPAAAGVGTGASLVWVTRDGREEPAVAEPRGYRYPRLSPDGTRVAFDDLGGGGEGRVWIHDFRRGGTTRFTDGTGMAAHPAWHPDGVRMAFLDDREAFGVHWQATDGTSDVENLSVTLAGGPQPVQSFSPDGADLLFVELDAKTGADLYRLSLDGDRQPTPLVQGDFNEGLGATVSPDGRWLAYASDESGEFEVYVRPFPDVDSGKVIVSRDGGFEPLWSLDGQELFYRNGDMMLSVSVQTSPQFSWEAAHEVFEGRYAFGPSRNYDVSADGTRFLMVKPSALTEGVSELVLVQNGFEELKARVPTRQ